MLTSLNRHYGLYQQMDFFVPSQYSFVLCAFYTIFDIVSVLLQRPAAPVGAAHMKRFHSDAYIGFISDVTPENEKAYAAQMKKCALYLISCDSH